MLAKRKSDGKVIEVKPQRGTVAIILLSMLGCWIGIGKDIFIYFAAFCIFWKVWDVLAWVVDRIADKIERKKEREYFGRLNKEQ